jgi:flagellar biogenesis protein FliO
MQALDSFTFLSTVSVSGDGYVFDLVKLIGFLGLLGAGAYFLTDFAKKRRVQSALSSEGKIVVADTCALGNKQFLVVAQYGPEKHLIGVSPNSIRHLSKLNSESNDFQQKLDEAKSMESEEQDA